jgi:hypothetical protein
VAREVPRSVRPLPDAYLPPALTIGFLLDAARDGKLPGPSGPLSPRQQAQFEVRLGVAQEAVAPLPATCTPTAGPIDISPPEGAVYRFTGPLLISSLEGGSVASAPVLFSPGNGQQLTIELPRMHLRVAAPGLAQVTLCRQP